MVLGIDFDNTIVRYDDLFHRLAVERGLIPSSLSPRKNEVRDYLRRQGQEREWTELQGWVYGPQMKEAQPFPGVLDFFTRCARAGLPLYIISHKTRTPVIGPDYDLHQTARDWLMAQGFLDPARGKLPAAHVLFGVTRQEKIRFIRETGCTHFVDDLEETFLEETFPPQIVRILFGRRELPPGLSGVKLAENWSEVAQYVFNAAN